MGTYKLDDEKATYDVIIAALKAGYLHIDTAQIYGNQKLIAKALKDSQVPREQIFITSKIWNSDHGYEETKKAIDRILAELEITYIDLVLIHWPTPKRLECWKALEEAVAAKKIRSIGLSNFQIVHIEELLKNCQIKPVINQFELHPALQRKDLVKYLQDNDIVVESWGTLIRGKCFEVEQVKVLAEKYQKSPAQICLRWAFQQGFVIIPKSSKPHRLIENTEIEDFALTAEDMALLATIPEYRDGPDPDNFDF
ncbi:aldo/keto reductase [Spiroplasma clarkii]|uniref:aldo/keto reductase n=1 Tax=Spiroplasma clarkii TaxID=2139 RepID=UPI0021505B10|nr:aldo/keto reductase [Spiroplasma clarkii]